ncbi:hypothetical protein SEVIR_3G389600v4 [Setaria viridis]|uniref:Glycosyltransferase n=2 Tax=Setaria TaxID=4554 RepID=K3ZEP0_SETIT|nr:UDP-glycosyltransferase 88A1 [Setaria italica]XP_034584219.1 UDP-glycosyltransferase 88A1-like [Setaria viridis]RCV19287.1 hypothetical protein SETIT_3G372400v2 [Setaria italica]TKW29343.1 hypothetical protein SEVIR_3G389600v2 [Setaria viridis]
MEGKTVVLYPGLGVGHLSPMLELSKGLLRHGGGAVDVAVVLVESPFKDPSFADTVARARASHTSVAFHVLPSPPPASGPSSGDAEHPVVGLIRFLRATNAPLRDLLRSLSSSASRPVRAVVLDMFCAHALDVAADLGLPAYFFFATGAAALAVFLALPGTRAREGKRFADLGDAVLPFAGVPPLRASELPPVLADDGAMCEAALRLASRVPEARGILVNSFEALEPRAVRALRDGLCVPGRPTPPVYCVGPLVSPGGGEKEHECLEWMDAQPDRSVVFLCFGSTGAPPKHQLAEIAAGLESSGQRFLWVVRSPPGAGGSPVPEPADDLDALLPAGFRERTRDRGLVVGSWAPQVDVLRHRATGAFLTHCGWNSTLEGVTAGVPLLCWPLAAEQGLNKVFIVEEMRLGVEMRRTSRAGDVVKAEEVEAKVRWVMEGSDDGARALRDRAAAARDRAAEALADGGTSQAAFLEFLKDLASVNV